MKTLNKKKAQRRINRVLRNMNDQILKDDLWNGRFYAYQLSSEMRPYYDNSGLTGHVHCLFKDLKSGYTKDYWFDLMDFEHPFTSHIWWAMNSFITEWAPVWTENPGPYKQPKVIYRADNSAPAL